MIEPFIVLISLHQKNQSAFQEFDIPGTPVVVAYNRGEEVERLEGAVSAATYDGFFCKT